MRAFWILIAGLALGVPAFAASDEVRTSLVTVEGQKMMLTNPGTDPAGARNPDVTLVEYFDYNCPFCKNLVPALQALMKQDPKVRIVYKDWPILGPVSRYAASSALAARWQGKYLTAHDALIGGHRLAQYDQVDETLKAAGINIDTLSRDRSAHAGEIAALLERNDEEAHALGLEGTPGIVVGRELLHGIAGLDELKLLVEHARKGQDSAKGQ